jgi:amino acid adenylation domain-containing protein
MQDASWQTICQQGIWLLEWWYSFKYKNQFLPSCMFKQSFPLTPNQARYVHAEQATCLRAHALSFQLPVSFYLPGDVNIEHLSVALQRLTDAYPQLRARLIRSRNGTFRQYIEKPSTPVIQVVQADEAIRANPRACIEAFCFDAADLHKQSLLKCQLIRLDAQHAIFTLSVHHMIADGYSLKRIIHALNQALQDINFAPNPIVHPQPALADQAQQIENTASQDAVAFKFWSIYLRDGQDATMPVIAGASHSRSTECTSIHLNADMSETILALCNKAEISLFQLIYAVYVTLLARHTGETNLMTAFQSHGRQQLAAHQHTIGLFARTLVLKHALQPDASLLDIAKVIQQSVAQAIDHQHMSYDAILQNSPHKPRYAINHFPQLPALVLNGASYPAQRLATWHSDFDCNLHIESAYATEDNNAAGSIELTLFFNPQVITFERASTFLQQMQLTLAQLVLQPTQPLHAFSLAASFHTTESTLKPMPAEISSPSTISIEKSARIEHAFFEIANKQPARIAIQDETDTWSYREVALAAQHITQMLAQQGARQHKRVAILCAQSPLLVMTMLATLQAEAAFCVLDPKLPRARLLQLLNTLEADCLITTLTSECFTQLHANTFTISIEQVKQVLMSQADILLPRLANADSSAPDNGAQAPAYYLFTSGSTGEPKCVMHTHAPLLHHIAWQRQTFSLTDEARVTMLSGLMHDPLMRDIFMPLSIGGRVCMASPHTMSQPAALRAWLHHIAPTVLHATPSMLLWLQTDAALCVPCNSIGLCLIGGEPLHQRHVAILRTFAPQASIINVYGTTETPQIMAWQRIGLTETAEVLPAGQAVADVEITILSKLDYDENKVTASPYTLGEVIIKSPYLAAGYWHHHALDESAFSHQTYHTGDLGYWNALRQLVLVGRTDDQIKIRGFRVSLSEIEYRLLQHPSVAECACVYDQERLTLALVPKTGTSMTAAEVRAYCQAQLPHYMQVTTVMLMDALPRLNNLKVDKQALIRRIQDDSVNDKLRLPESDMEIAIAESWRRILGLKFISADTSFVSLGGDSLSFIQASLALERAIGFVPNNWQHLRICDLATQSQSESMWASIHPAVFVRAFSIVFILVGHFFNRNLTGGTDALLLVAGYSFAGFQLNNLYVKKSVKPLFNTMLGIAIPTLLISLVHFYKIKGIDIPRVLFYGNFILPYNALHEPQYELYWFIDVLIQIFLVLAVVFSVESLREKAARHPLRFATYALLLSAIIAVLSAQVWDTDYLLNRVPQAKLWLFVLGWAVYFAYHQQQKLLFAAIAIGLPVLLNGKPSPLMSCCALLLLYVPHIKLIRPFHTWVYAVASASLMIYLTHFQLSSALRYMGIEDTPYAELFVGILGGVALWHAWQWLVVTSQQA